MRFALHILCLTLLAVASGASASSIAIHAGNHQLGQPGHSVGIRPAVRVTDSYGLPVSGEAVAFSVESGGGLLSGPNQTSNALGVATVGAWALGANPGPKQLRATLLSNGSYVIFDAIAEAETNLRVSMTLEADIVAGLPFLYLITVSNNGPYEARDVQVSMDYDPLIVESSRAWQCVPGGGSASCSSGAVGPLLDHASIPPMGHVSYTVASAVPVHLSSGQVTSSVEIIPPVGLALSNPALATDEASGSINPNPQPIHADRFERAEDPATTP